MAEAFGVTDAAIRRTVPATGAVVEISELEALLLRLHELGTIMYFPEPRLRSRVVLDPSRLVELASRIIRDPQNHPSPGSQAESDKELRERDKHTKAKFPAAWADLYGRSGQAAGGGGGGGGGGGLLREELL
ncbi:MAG: hypothetical protein AAFR65_16655, partial [Pseudomonadota bacterium]